MTFYPITIASSSRVQTDAADLAPKLASCALNPMLCHFSRESAFRRVASVRTRVAACETANLHRPFQPEVGTLQRVTPGSW